MSQGVPSGSPLAGCLFVSNLPWTLGEEQLKAAFAQHGEVLEARVQRFQKPPYRSRGFGFVTLRTEAQARSAQALMHGAELAGRSLNVELSEPREPRFPRPQPGERSRVSRPQRTHSPLQTAWPGGCSA